MMKNLKKHIGEDGRLTSYASLLTFIFILCNCIYTYGQQEINSTFYRTLTTNKYNQQRFKEDKSYEDKFVANETVALTERQDHKIVPEGFTLSIVFHALYSEDKTKVSQDVAIQLAALNRDFGIVKPKTYPDKHPNNKYAALATSPNIKFELFQSEQSKMEADGISIIMERRNRIQQFGDLKKDIIKEAKSITPNKVINVWVVKSDDDIGSFAQMPGGPSDVDGIVIDHRVFGAGTPPFDQGKTLTHLVGNYLGLIDLWGIYPCQDDGVIDTPVHNSPNYNFPQYQHLSTCPGQGQEMNINFMDAMPDEEMWMFTEGQVRRMHHMLSKSGPRHQLAKT